eukprot:2238335-Prymnesium_polylepis.1
MPPFTSVALTGFLIQSGPSLHMPPSTMATISGLVMPLRGAALAMQDDGNSSARRAALSGFAKAAAVVTLTDVALDVVEQVTGALPDARQAATQRKEAVANAKRLAKVAQQEQATASRLVADAQQAAEAVADAERYALAARLGRVPLTAEEMEEAKANAERLSRAAEVARAKGQAAVVERIRAEDSVVARTTQLNAAASRLRLIQTLATGASVVISYYGLTAMAERVRQSRELADLGGSAIDSREAGGQRSAPDIFRRGLANLAEDPFGWFFGGPSP